MLVLQRCILLLSYWLFDSWLSYKRMLNVVAHPHIRHASFSTMQQCCGKTSQTVIFWSEEMSMPGQKILLIIFRKLMVALSHQEPIRIKNKHGNSFITFLKENRSVILNGRITPELNNFTFVSPNRGCSIPD